MSDDSAKAEAERITAALVKELPDSFSITASGPNCYLGKYSWAADKEDRDDIDSLCCAASDAIIKLTGPNPHNADITFDARIHRFVNGITRERFRAMLIFVRVPGANERIVVIPAE